MLPWKPNKGRMPAMLSANTLRVKTTWRNCSGRGGLWPFPSVTFLVPCWNSCALAQWTLVKVIGSYMELATSELGLFPYSAHVDLIPHRWTVTWGKGQITVPGPAPRLLGQFLEKLMRSCMAGLLGFLLNPSEWRQDHKCPTELCEYKIFI